MLLTNLDDSWPICRSSLDFWSLGPSCGQFSPGRGFDSVICCSLQSVWHRIGSRTTGVGTEVWYSGSQSLVTPWCFVSMSPFSALWSPSLKNDQKVSKWGSLMGNMIILTKMAEQSEKLRGVASQAQIRRVMGSQELVFVRTVQSHKTRW